MIEAITKSLAMVLRPRLYETERGFQGEFLANLRAALPDAGLPGDAIVEQEYQKRLRDHGIKVRPDIIIHVPTPPGEDRRQGNFAVFELKLAARADAALEDFDSLDGNLSALNYPLGIFVNIAADETHGSRYRGPFPDRIHTSQRGSSTDVLKSDTRASTADTLLSIRCRVTTLMSHAEFGGHSYASHIPGSLLRTLPTRGSTGKDFISPAL